MIHRKFTGTKYERERGGMRKERAGWVTRNHFPAGCQLA